MLPCGIIALMKKLSKKEVIDLLMTKDCTFKELAQITGYHEKSLIRLNKEIKNNNISVEHGNKNKKPHNYVDENIKKAIVTMFTKRDYKNYKDFYKTFNKYSYPFICKVLRENNIKAKNRFFLFKLFKKNK